MAAVKNTTKIRHLTQAEKEVIRFGFGMLTLDEWEEAFNYEVERKSIEKYLKHISHQNDVRRKPFITTARKD